MIRRLISTAAILLAATPAPALAAGPFTLASARFRDNAVLPAAYTGNLATNPNCIGKNLAPPLAWSDVPAGTKSFVLMMIDPEGRGGLGVTHWMAYGIPASRTAFTADEIVRAPTGYTGGKSTQGLDHYLGPCTPPGTSYYLGPCTPPGTSYHHYTFVIIATDLEQGALAAGLTREELTPLLVGHSKGSAGLVVRFRHP